MARAGWPAIGFHAMGYPNAYTEIPCSAYIGRQENESLFSLSDGPIKLPNNWSSLVQDQMDEDDLNHLNNSIKRGAPLGESLWARETARKIKIESTLNPRGRPRKGTAHL